jgi:molecular chaperone HtpG
MSNEAIDVGEALESLVHQFADPWSFLRELIQNAIDAGSPEIDVRLEHQPSQAPEDPGMMIVEVVDAGDGMDRQIIDTRLTRLFSSAKDGDYTKIGRFGIGFVSVFAIDPDLVCVDTGRAGEYWRVLFRSDRSFERIVLEQPVEGTTIRVFKRANERAVEAARARARRTLEYWCKHARVEVRFDDEPISRPMALDGHCVISHHEEGTTLLLGYVEARAALRGYYHAGLTLHEEHDDRLPHVAFKIDSRFLEHTLTRDNVIRDENFAKAMAIVGRLARTSLLDELVRECERAAVEGRRDAQAEFLRARLLGEVEAAEFNPRKLAVEVFERPLVPTVQGYRDGRAGEPISLAEVRRQIRRCWVASAASPVTDLLRERGDRVLALAPGSALLQLITTHAQRAPLDVRSVCTPQPATPAENHRWQRLRAALIATLARAGQQVADIGLGHLAYPDSPVAEHVAITQASFGELTKVEDIGTLTSGWFRSRRVVVLNADHPTVAHLLEIAGREPELAAYLTLKLFFLRTALEPKLDGALASFAAEARWQRSTS